MSLHHKLKRLITSWLIVADTGFVLLANIWDRARLGNKMTLSVALWLTIDSYFRGWDYLYTHEMTMAGASAIGAILVPLTTLLGWVYRTYNVNAAPSSALPCEPRMPAEGVPDDGPKPPAKGVFDQ